MFYPSAFWLEPQWRDKQKFSLDWLLREAAERDIVMLLHADNVTSDPEIMREFRAAVEKLESVILPVPGAPREPLRKSLTHVLLSRRNRAIPTQKQLARQNRASIPPEHPALRAQASVCEKQ